MLKTLFVLNTVFKFRKITIRDNKTIYILRVFVNSKIDQRGMTLG